MENVRKRRYTKLITTERRRNYLLSEPNYHIDVFHRKFISKRNKKKIRMSKPVSLGLSIAELSKIGICEFCYDYVKPKYNKKAKLCYMDIDSFILHL